MAHQKNYFLKLKQYSRIIINKKSFYTYLEVPIEIIYQLQKVISQYKSHSNALYILTVESR